MYSLYKYMQTRAQTQTHTHTEMIKYDRVGVCICVAVADACLLMLMIMMMKSSISFRLLFSLPLSLTHTVCVCALYGGELNRFWTHRQLHTTPLLCGIYSRCENKATKQLNKITISLHHHSVFFSLSFYIPVWQHTHAQTV